MLTRRQILGRLLASTFAAVTVPAQADNFFLGGNLSEAERKERTDFFLGGRGHLHTGGNGVQQQTTPEQEKPERMPSRVVAYNGTAAVGSILVSTETYRLYFIQSAKTAVEYPIGVGRDEMAIPGSSYIITAKRVHPEWRPTPRMRAENPSLPVVVPAGPHNPMGTRALNLGDTFYRIHGTNEPETVGTSASSGCIRMYNDHVELLFEKVRVGARVEIYNEGIVPGITNNSVKIAGARPRMGG